MSETAISNCKTVALLPPMWRLVTAKTALGEFWLLSEQSPNIASTRQSGLLGPAGLRLANDLNEFHSPRLRNLVELDRRWFGAHLHQNKQLPVHF